VLQEVMSDPTIASDGEALFAESIMASIACHQCSDSQVASPVPGCT